MSIFFAICTSVLICKSVSYIDFLLNIFLILPNVWREKYLFLAWPEAPKGLAGATGLGLAEGTDFSSTFSVSLSTPSGSASPGLITCGFLIFLGFLAVGTNSPKTNFTEQVLFLRGVARPMARGSQRFSVGPASTKILAIYKLFSSRLKLCLALAVAELSNFKIRGAGFLTINASWFFACATLMPLIRLATNLTFRGAILKLFKFALISMDYRLQIFLQIYR